ncbi:GNAT family N-acetyltransferase [Aeromicrobium sp. Leaf350]|uniref:GNAT family N-acetyltransferase n=1 Tax=Aeromicrobium sp. Leaf350 TaxID=2876565 RepID=UPI001E419DB9|nr:GNAT family N-acetyltransferase [Aeromicrobium sp. Leaf350]
MSASDPALVRTSRTLLRPPVEDDLDAVYAIYGDPATWKHLPSGLGDRAMTADMLAMMIAGWRRFGLDTWVVEDVDAQVVGIAGTRRVEGRVLRNLGYRLSPAVWGSGLATEVAQAALEAAHEHDPGTPVVARVLVNNPASVRVLEKLGLRLLFEGPRDDGLVRQVHADRDLTPDDLAHLVSLG